MVFLVGTFAQILWERVPKFKSGRESANVPGKWVSADFIRNLSKITSDDDPGTVYCLTSKCEPNLKTVQQLKKTTRSENRESADF